MRLHSPRVARDASRPGAKGPEDSEGTGPSPQLWNIGGASVRKKHQQKGSTFGKKAGFQLPKTMLSSFPDVVPTNQQNQNRLIQDLMIQVSLDTTASQGPKQQI